MKKIVALFQSCRTVEYASVMMLFALLGIYRFSTVLFIENMALTNQGDGIGTMAMMGALRDLFDSKGLLGYIFSEPLIQYSFGDGLLPRLPFFSALWRVFLLPFVLMGVEPQNIYDIWGFALFVMTGVSGYYLARVLGSGYLLAIFAGLLFVGMDNMSFRLTGHMSLSSPFMILMQTGLAITAAKNNGWKDYFWLVIVTWLSFQANEYYGFYGLVYSGLIFAGFFLINAKKNMATSQKVRDILAKLTSAFLLLCLLMFLSYSTIILARLGIGVSASSLLNQLSHDLGALHAFSVNNPLGLFLPSLPGVHTSLSVSNTAEFSFRIGLAIAVSIMILGLVLWVSGRRSLNERYSMGDWYKPAAIFMVAGLVLALMGVSPSYKLSLAEVVFHIAPMFRVAARAYILVDISLVVILVIIASAYLRLAWQTQQLFVLRLMKISLVSILLALVYVDVTRSIVPPRFTAYQLPQKASLFNAVPAGADGQVIELPFWPPSSPPEQSYEYLYNWALHKHPLVNAPFNILNKSNPTMAHKLELFAADVNRTDDRMANALGHAGIRYLMANCGSMDFGYLKNLHGLKQLNSDGCSVLYEISGFNANGKFVDLLKTYK